MSAFSTRISFDPMEDAWATPLPSRACSSRDSSKRGRSNSPPSRSAGSGPHTTLPWLVCFT
eukprot:4190971-Prymnesium_polylepis.1